MRHTPILGLLVVAACQGGSSTSGSNALLENERDAQGRADGTMNGGTETPEPERPFDAKCEELRLRSEACWQQAAPACESAYEALSQCHDAASAACSTQIAALEACFHRRDSDCSSEIEAVETCRYAHAPCTAQEEAAWSCGSACFELDNQLFGACYPVDPSPNDYCFHLYEALSLCQGEPANIEEDGVSRCGSIEVAIAELCSPPVEPCEVPPDSGHDDDENQKDPNGSGMSGPNGGR